MSVSTANKRLKKTRRDRLELLSEWYGREFAATEIAAHVSAPVPLERGVRAVMATLETPERKMLRILREEWSRTVGDDLAKLATPLSWENGLLMLEVRHGALLRELQPSLEFFLAAVRSRFPESDCREVRLTVSGGGRRSPRFTS